MLLREIFIGGARAPPAPPHATALVFFQTSFKVIWFLLWCVAHDRITAHNLTSDYHGSLVGNLEKHYTSILQASSDVSQSDGLKRSLRGSC